MKRLFHVVHTPLCHVIKVTVDVMIAIIVLFPFEKLLSCSRPWHCLSFRPRSSSLASVASEFCVGWIVLLIPLHSTCTQLCAPFYLFIFFMF